MFPRDQNQPSAGERERKEMKSRETQMTKEHHVLSDSQVEKTRWPADNHRTGKPCQGPDSPEVPGVRDHPGSG